MRNVFVFILSAIFFWTPLNIWAAINGEYSGKFTLDEIVVEGDRSETESTGQTQIIQAEELNQRGVKTLDQALQLVPGINIRVGGNGSPRIDMLGYKDRHVLLLLDGVPLNSTFDGQVDPRMIPVEIIKKIKVSYGASSSLYGSGALGGVINIITRRGEAKDKLFLQEEAGTGLKQYGALRASGKEGKFDYILGLNNEQSDGFELSKSFTPTSTEDGGKRKNSDFRRSSMFLRFGLTPSENWQWGVTFSTQNSAYGLPPLTIADMSDPFATRVKYERVNNDDRQIFQLTTSYVASGPWEYKFWFYQNSQAVESSDYDDANYLGMTNPKVNGTYHQNTNTLIRGETFQATRSMGKDSKLTISLTSESDEWTADGQIRDVAVTPNIIAGSIVGAGTGTGGGTGKGTGTGTGGSTGTTTGAGTGTGTGTSTGTTTGAGTGTGGGGGGGKNSNKTYDIRSFDDTRTLHIQTLSTEYMCKPFQNLRLSLGGSLCKLFRDTQDNDSQGEFRLGASRELSDATSIHAAAARKVRFPTIQELYDETSGNANLTTEHSMNYELGLTHQMSKRTTLGMILFSSTVSNYIEKDTTANLFKNYEDYLFKGVEFTFRHNYRRPLLLESGLTLMNSKDLTSGSGRDELQFRPKFKFTVSGTYTSHNGSMAHLELLYVDGQNFYSRTLPLQKASLNCISVANARLSTPVRKSGLTAFLGVNNIFDRNYETAYGVPAPGRMIYSGLQGNF
ncbi:MAG: TonB-dependent receptor plug domain-containing protein [Candidatus Riflebacteria bacterium]|nr:TonB-dependent receptor plug domain-containing protein [Candidatus Riflebacteria bacterium]